MFFYSWFIQGGGLSTVMSAINKIQPYAQLGPNTHFS